MGIIKLLSASESSSGQGPYASSSDSNANYASTITENNTKENNMKVFKDLISGDEFFSDSYPHELICEDAGIEAMAKYVTKGAEHIDIGCHDEEEEVAGETVIDIQDKFALNEIQGWSKAEFMQWAKAYLAKIIAKLTEQGKEDRIPGFKRGATQMIKMIVGKWSEMQIFCGEKMDYEGALCFAYQKNQEDEGPTAIFFKDGFKEMKY